MALPLIAALLAAASAQADPVKIRVSYVVAPSDWAPLLPENPRLGFVKAPIDVQCTDLS